MHMLPGQSLMHDNKLVVNAIIVCTTKTMYIRICVSFTFCLQLVTLGQYFLHGFYINNSPMHACSITFKHLIA